MRILEVRLSGFGRFSDLTLTFPSSFTLLVGPNEAGKSTVVDAITGVLFGFRRGQKNLRERYQPAQGRQYSASLVMADEDGTRYLVGRDFNHDRLEVFRGQGVRLETLGEGELEAVLQNILGIHTVQLFESILLLRQPEMNLVVRDRGAASRLSEALGRKISGGDENTTANEALKAIKEKLADLETAVGAGSLSELAAEVAEKESELALFDQGCAQYAALVEERDRLRAGLAALQAEQKEIEGRVAGAMAAKTSSETRKKLIDELTEVRTRLAEAGTAEGGANAGEAGALPIEPSLVARAEELADRIAALDVEQRFEEEEDRQYRTEVELLRQEIAMTKAKLDLLDQALLSPEVQNRLSALMPVVNENSARLGALFQQVDRFLEALRRLTTVRGIAFVLSFFSGMAALGAAEFLPPPRAWLITGAAGAAVLLTGILVVWSARLKAAARKLSAEIDRREAGLKEKKAEIDQILQGKTPSQFQAELEASKVYQKDLWDLEQLLAQKQAKAQEKQGSVRPGGNLMDMRRELADILAAAGCRDVAELRTRAALSVHGVTEEIRPSPAGEGPSREELSRRQGEIEEELAMLAPDPTEADPGGLDLLVERQEKLAGQIDAARMRLAELGAEIRNYQDFVLVKDRFEVQENLASAKARLARMQIKRQGLAMAAKRLEEAIFETRAQLGPELQEQAGEILAEITGGRYREVRFDLSPGNLDLSLRSPETGALVDPASLSAGTADQYYLALRLALALRLTHGRSFPLILDDPFISFDRERLRGAAKVLARLARVHQVIWLTKDPGLAALIGEATGLEPSVEELPSGYGELGSAGEPGVAPAS